MTLMKKILPFAAAVILLLTGCSLTFLNKTDQTIQNDPPEPPPVESQAPSIPEDSAPDPSGDTPDSPPAAEPVQPEDPAPAVEPEKEEKTISLTHTDVTLRTEGETFTLNLQNVPGIYASTYTSADPGIASVDEMTGLVTAVAPGVTTITVHLESEAGVRDFQCIVRCSWEEAGTESSSGEPAQPVSSRPALSDFFAQLQGTYDGLGAMLAMDGELLENYYPGLSEIESIEEILIQETMISMSNVAVGLVKLKEDAPLEDVIAVQDVFQTRMTTQADGGAWYPESCETWKQGILTSVSNCVGMFISPENAQDMADDFITAFSRS